MKVVGAGGVELAVEDRPGEGRPVLFVHATGFCKETWWPVVEGLAGHHVLVDQRGHGESGSPEPPIDWWDLATDVLAVIDATGLDRPIGVGHSSGAAALAMAEVSRPGTFSELVLVEPIMFPGHVRREEDNPMSAAALKRRRSFPTRDHAFESYLGRGPFAHWDERVLRAYVDHAFEPAGDAWALRCSPEIEAEFYRGATATGAFGRLGEIGCQVTLMAGADSDTHSGPLLDALTGAIPQVETVVVPGASHFVPMEYPEAVAAAIRS